MRLKLTVKAAAIIFLERGEVSSSRLPCQDAPLFHPISKGTRIHPVVAKSNSVTIKY